MHLISTLQAIKDFCPDEDFHLAGYSFGACVVQEMALQMQEEGQSKRLLSLTLLDGSHKLVPKFIEQMQTDNYREMEILRLLIGRQGGKVWFVKIYHRVRLHLLSILHVY